MSLVIPPLPDVFVAICIGIGSLTISLVILELPDVFVAICIGIGSPAIAAIPTNTFAPTYIGKDGQGYQKDYLVNGPRGTDCLQAVKA